jgi:hypothetical protein
MDCAGVARHRFAKSQPELAAKLTKRLHDRRRQVNAWMPKPNPNYPPAKAKGASRRFI